MVKRAALAEYGYLNGYLLSDFNLMLQSGVLLKRASVASILANTAKLVKHSRHKYNGAF